MKVRKYSNYYIDTRKFTMLYLYVAVQLFHKSDPDKSELAASSAWSVEGCKRSFYPTIRNGYERICKHFSRLIVGCSNNLY